MDFANVHSILTIRSALAGRTKHSSMQNNNIQSPLAFYRQAEATNRKTFKFYLTQVQQAAF
jgi:hypothetical protein